MFPFKYPRTSQPQGAVPAAKTGLASGLVCLFNGATPNYDPLGKSAFAPDATTTRTVGGFGKSLKSAAAGTYAPAGVVVSNGAAIAAGDSPGAPTMSVLIYLNKWISSAGGNLGYSLIDFYTGVGYPPMLGIDASGFVKFGYYGAPVTSSNSITSGQSAVIMVEMGPAGYYINFNGVETLVGGSGYGTTGAIKGLCNGLSGQGNIIAEVAMIAVSQGASLRGALTNPWQLFQSANRSLFAPSVVSISRPTADVTTTGWTGNPDNVTLFTNINEVSPNNSTFIESPAITGTGDPTVFDFLPTKPAGTWDVSVIAQFTGSSADVRVIMMDASDTVQGTSAWQTVTSTWVTYPISVTTTGTSSRVKVEVR